MFNMVNAQFNGNRGLCYLPLCIEIVDFFAFAEQKGTKNCERGPLRA